MATFVLVHGAWHGSWCWKRVRKKLLNLGHDVFTPTLTGIGERSHLLSPQVNLDTHIDDIVNLMRWEELTDVVLCGHSYGGAVITGAADRMPARIRTLVYLDAFLLEHGQSVHDALPATHRDNQLDLATRLGDGWRVPPIPAEVFNVNAADRAWVNQQCTWQSIECFRQPLRLNGGLRQIKNFLYIFASGWEESPFPPFFEQAMQKGWKALTLRCGHDVMLDRPDDLTDMLVAAI
jgi:pimeloyl-ACP methyl ester carboxylesterase